MADFLTTLGTSSKIEEIINYSKKELFLISPYYQLSDIFYSRLSEASDRGVDINIVFGKGQLKDKEFQSFANIPSVNLYYCHNVHAKCYFNEKNMVITSMNMYAFSEKNNREMGIYIQIDEDYKLYYQAKQEAESIINASELILPRSNSHGYGNFSNNQSNSNGYCIRCRTNIDLNSETPFCKSCFSSWNDFRNYDYQENYCHLCGKNEYSSYRKPVCYDCYQTRSNRSRR